MFFLNLKRIIKSGWLGFRRNWWLSVATISMMLITLLVVSGLLFFNVTVHSMIASIQEKVDISAYFKLGLDEDQILTVRDDVLNLPEVKSVEYISYNEALYRFREKHQDNPVLIQGLQELEGNPFAASLNIKAKAAGQFASIVSFLEQPRFKNLIEKINYKKNKEVIDKINVFTATIQRTGFISSLVLAFIAGIISFNTIRLTIHNSRNKISVMRLVGASNWYIRGPFVVEGILYGVAAALICLLLLFPVLYFISPKLANFMPEVDLFLWFRVNFWSVLLFQLSIAIILGGISSFVAIRRYLEI